MKIIHLFLIILIVNLNKTVTNDNTIIVEYSHSIHLEGLPSETRVNAKLIANKSKSMYEMDFMGSSNLIEEDSDNGAVLSIKPTNNPIIFKNFVTKNVYSVERILMKPHIVKDDLNIFKWKLIDNYKTILGYKCQEANITHRGRNYIAYFTTEIPFKVGPWKFDGLPGLILEIESVDGAFKINATKLEIKNIQSEIVIPYSETETISWQEFIALYNQKYNELLHYRDEGGGTRSIPLKNIEEFIKK